jgi:hypothetical protein
MTKDIRARAACSRPPHKHVELYCGSSNYDHVLHIHRERCAVKQLYTPLLCFRITAPRNLVEGYTASSFRLGSSPKQNALRPSAWPTRAILVSWSMRGLRCVHKCGDSWRNGEGRPFVSHDEPAVSLHSDGKLFTSLWYLPGSHDRCAVLLLMAAGYGAPPDWGLAVRCGCHCRWICFLHFCFCTGRMTDYLDEVMLKDGSRTLQVANHRQG